MVFKSNNEELLNSIQPFSFNILTTKSGLVIQINFAEGNKIIK